MRGNNYRPTEIRSLVSAQTNRKINTQYTVYGVQNGVTNQSFYSLSGSTSQIAPTLKEDLLADFLLSSEFQSLKSQFNFCKITSVSLVATGTLFQNSNVTDLPPLFVMVSGGFSGSFAANSVALSDSALEVKLSSANNYGICIKYKMPKVLIGVNGYPIGGSDVWIGTNALASTGAITAGIGYLNPPTWAAGASYNPVVCRIDVYWDVTFGGPTITV